MPLRRVVRIPLEQLWSDSGAVNANRGPHISTDRIRELFRLGIKELVIADLGAVPEWHKGDDALRIWRKIRPNLREGSRPRVEDYPGHFFYWASEWRAENGDTIVVLEKYH